MAFTTMGTPTTMGLSCTNMVGGVVTITVPRNGTLVIHADANVHINHVWGLADAWKLGIGTTASDCSGEAGFWYDEIWAEITSHESMMSAFVQRIVGVTAGVYSFYLNGIWLNGADATDYISEANLVAIFYPS